ncbi:GLPGLI family protein [Cecembia lonarensis]|uniref:GLPGLI family protein n=1 Tax=Cecembia lonarensis (strain CCUG 58316 / KCTC 22772 / LW9) TaxID=1225176 RepID=K1L4A7_CECL9|nr:GLPGLI family protein [Cecembia lonarensis]EKB49626.1 GLPGLI family protein [Cecembia lonarensis LW9]
MALSKILNLGLLILFVALQYIENERKLLVEYSVTRGDREILGVLFADFNGSRYFYQTDEIKNRWNEFLEENLSNQKKSFEIGFVSIEHKKNELLSTEFLANKDYVLVKDEIPELQWNITEERKMILGFECRKAKTHFRCADYTAWFASDISISAGPWKITGLPGLILELNNDTVGENFQATKVEYPAKPKKIFNDFKPVTSKLFETFAAFGDAQKSEVKKFKDFLRAQMNLPDDAEVHIEERECY